MQHVLPDTARSDDGVLVIGGCRATDLAADFGTPLIVYDRDTVEARAASFTEAVGAGNVLYAGKAFLCVAICELIDSLGLCLDVCTGGELATALAAGFPAERIYFHGNNKSIDELRAARAAGVGRIVIDSFDEIDRLHEIPATPRALVRITPGVEAHTHEFVQTGQEDSKFGFGLADGVAFEAVKRALQIPNVELVGLHAHIGSQIFELAAFDLAVQRIAAFAAEVSRELDFQVTELDLGGGLGIAHTRDEVTPDPGESAARITASARAAFSAAGLPEPEIALEPGRSLIGSSAVTLYRVGTVKRIPGVRTYVSVDGGMSDNIRPALYGARYEAFLPERMDAAPGPRVTIAGKHCESGDVLIRDAHLPDDVAPGDLLCIPATGAYTYSMSSNYNHVPRPAVVMVQGGTATEIVRRETYNDLMGLNRRLDGRGALG